MQTIETSSDNNPMDLTQIRSPIILGVFLSKALLMGLAAVLGRLLTKRSGEGDALLGCVIGIFCMMSDDLGVGYSTLRVVFPEVLYLLPTALRFSSMAPLS